MVYEPCRCNVEFGFLRGGHGPPPKHVPAFILGFSYDKGKPAIQSRSDFPKSARPKDVSDEIWFSPVSFEKF